MSGCLMNRLAKLILVYQTSLIVEKDLPKYRYY